MSELFEYLAANEELDKAQSRKALALARARATKRFSNFLDGPGDRNQRLALVAGDLTETVRQACADVYYDDWESVLASVQQHLGFTVEARLPKMCPVHREITDISLQQGDPQAGFAAMAQHMFGDNSCRGEVWEGKCRFKPEMTTQSYWDSKAEKAEERRLERERMRSENSDQWDNEGGGQPREMDRPEQPEPDELGGVPPSQPEPTPDDAQVPESLDSLTDSDWAMATEDQMVMASTICSHGRVASICPMCGGSGQVSDDATDDANVVDQRRGSVRQADALKTVDVEQGGEGPSPKMDKRKWTPENVSFLDVEMDGSPHPTRHQDIAEPADYKSSDPDDDDGRFEQTKAVLEKQDVDKDSDYAGSSARGQQGGSFGGGGRSAVGATQVPNPALHPGSMQPLAKIHQNVGGLVINGLPFEQFEQEFPNHIGQPATVEHPHPTWEGVAAKVLERGSSAPLMEYMAVTNHNKGKHEGMPKKGCPLCQQGQGGPEAAPPMLPGGEPPAQVPGNYGATDPDLNPITEFLTDEEEQRAIEEYNERS